VTLYFLSDYGLEDEFVGVVHAVLDRLAPGVPVVDLAHGVAPFDVAAGAAALARCAPFLGDGAVVAVVDPGVGTDRRSVAVEVDPGGGGPQWLVGPDNGLLLPAADVLGGARSVVVLDPARLPAAAVLPATAPATTFDGRDVFAPAAALLVTGVDPGLLGAPAEVASLAPAPISPPVVQPARSDGRGAHLATSVVGVDRFGNVQLAAAAPALDTLGLSLGDTVSVTIDPERGAAGTATVGTGRDGAHATTVVAATVVRAFAACPPGGLGLLVDAAGHLALVADRAPAADRLAAGAVPGALVGAEVRLERRR
jgi:S-adenosylmethionine hydrolase